MVGCLGQHRSLRFGLVRSGPSTAGLNVPFRRVGERPKDFLHLWRLAGSEEVTA
ncbi:hypothetical protein Salmuc_05203 [Salipiger mucosus DSM 16094]|uniref:Uncharacterized protein n=1 Tax=Salipiger mucosus DSM 16094 TaxID=1123237 RepID=S9S882_9RHOB|nr:hypothetical protein Salmuc_05203 [Salipiger mucosus DSM 16094]